MKANGLRESGSIAKKVFLIAVAIGVAEIIVGYLSLSLALVADGIHSLAMAIVFLIIWIGLHLSGRSPDGKFHFGYYRFETLGSLIAAFFLAAFGGIIIYEAYLVWLEPRSIVNTGLALAVALVSTIIATCVTVRIQKVSKKRGSTSLKMGALNGAIDAVSSLAVCVSIVLSGYFGIQHADSIAGVIIAFAIFVVAYSIMKESSMVLVDACNCGDTVKAISDVAKSVEGIKEIHSIRMRKLGPYIVGDMHIVVAGQMLVREADLIATQVEEKIKRQFGDIIEFKIRIESDDTYNKRS